MAHPEITPELAARTLPGSFPGDLGIELVSISDDDKLSALFVCTQIVLHHAAP